MAFISCTVHKRSPSDKFWWTCELVPWTSFTYKVACRSHLKGMCFLYQGLGGKKLEYDVPMSPRKGCRQVRHNGVTLWYVGNNNFPQNIMLSSNITKKPKPLLGNVGILHLFLASSHSTPDKCTTIPRHLAHWTSPCELHLCMAWLEKSI